MSKIQCPARDVLIEEEQCRREQLSGAEACLACAKYYRKLPTFLLAQRLLKEEGMTGELEYHVDGDFFSWKFHDALSLTVTTGEHGYGYIEPDEKKKDPFRDRYARLYGEGRDRMTRRGTGAGGEKRV